MVHPKEHNDLFFFNGPGKTLQKRKLWQISLAKIYILPEAIYSQPLYTPEAASEFTVLSASWVFVSFPFKSGQVNMRLASPVE